MREGRGKRGREGGRELEGEDEGGEGVREEGRDRGGGN